MKFKNLLTGLVIFGLLFPAGAVFAASKNVQVPTSFIYQAINKYRDKNYTGCIQDMDYIIQKGRPTDVAYYYKAISYSQLGIPDKAREAYEAARSISKNRVLIDYATQAVNCIDDATLCDSNLDESDITRFIKSDDFMHSDVKATLENQAIERAKAEINNDVPPDEETLKYLNQNNPPTDKEIADAVRTFSKLGINPFGSMNPFGGFKGMNSEIAQINAMFGNNNNNNNNMMNLIPMLSAMTSSGPNGNSAMSKEFVQAYMMNQMLPGLDFSSSNK